MVLDFWVFFRFIAVNHETIAQNQNAIAVNYNAIAENEITIVGYSIDIIIIEFYFSTSSILGWRKNFW